MEGRLHAEAKMRNRLWSAVRNQLCCVCARVLMGLWVLV